MAEKSGLFFPQDPLKHMDVMQRIFFQVEGADPMFGQFGHFYKFAKDKCDHPYPVEHYSNELTETTPKLKRYNIYTKKTKKEFRR